MTKDMANMASDAVGSMAKAARVRCMSDDGAVDFDATDQQQHHPDEESKEPPQQQQRSIEVPFEGDGISEHETAPSLLSEHPTVGNNKVASQPSSPIDSPITKHHQGRLKKAVGGTAKILDKAKHQLAKPLPKKEHSAKTVDAVASSERKCSSQTKKVKKESDDLSVAAAISKNYNKTIRWSKNTFRKTSKSLQRKLRRGKHKNLSRTMMSSVHSDLTMDNVDSDDDTDITGENENVLEIVVTERLKFWLHDVTVAMCILTLFAAIPTIRNWHRIVNHQLPQSVGVVWLLCAFCAGMEIGRCRGMRSRRKTAKKGDDVATIIDAFSTAKSESTRSTHPPSQVMVPAEKEEESGFDEGYALIVGLLAPFMNVRLTYAHEAAKSAMLTTTAMVKATELQEQFWSTLNHASSREAWEQVGFVKVADPLMNRLLRNADHPRRALKDIVQEQESASGEEGDSQCARNGKRIGTFDISQQDMSVLERDVIDPSFKLRGMDIFLTDDAEADMASHPFLIKQGLRNRPTFVVNIMVQWANILMYFELPEWFTDFENVVENDDDSNDVKAIKVRLPRYILALINFPVSCFVLFVLANCCFV